MSKSSKIREALTAGPLPLSQLLEKTGILGRKSAYDLCCYMRGRGEMKITPGEDPVIALTGKKGKTAPPQKTKTPRGRRTVTLKGIVRKHTVTDEPLTLHRLALTNLLAAGNHLRVVIHTNIDGIDDDAILKAALDNHDRAEQILRAARAA